jgi:hypothetical protein
MISVQPPCYVSHCSILLKMHATQFLIILPKDSLQDVVPESLLLSFQGETVCLFQLQHLWGMPVFFFVIDITENCLPLVFPPGWVVLCKYYSPSVLCLPINILLMCVHSFLTLFLMFFLTWSCHLVLCFHSDHLTSSFFIASKESYCCLCKTHVSASGFLILQTFLVLFILSWFLLISTLGSVLMFYPLVSSSFFFLLFLGGGYTANIFISSQCNYSLSCLLSWYKQYIF